ncbi:nucleotidyltransferase [Halanaerobaculum tunisiense]
MNILGIITEYNPFHLGHKIHLQKSVTKSKADATICIMSGSFLQRGRPAIVNQWARAQMALDSGVDLIIQLPVTYSVRSAEYFAWGAVKSLAATNLVDILSFGSELGKIQPLQQLGQLLATEPPHLSTLIQQELNQGVSYPQARSKALDNYLTSTAAQIDITPDQAQEIITNPNNILGLEYIKALTNLDASITPITIKREGADYHSHELKEIASGSGIRHQIKSNQKNQKRLLTPQITQTLPQVTTQVLDKEFTANRGPIFIDQWEAELLTILRRIKKTKLQNYAGVTGGLENRIKAAALEATSLPELITKIKTKRFTQTRIQRILIQLLLDLSADKLTKFDQHGGPQYLRVLGFNQQGRKLLKLIKNQVDLPLITKVANYFKTKQTPRNLLQEMLQYDLVANDLYTLAYSNQQARRGGVDFRQQPILDLADN